MIVDGRQISKDFEKKIKDTILRNNLKKKLFIFYVGENPVIDQFVKIKKNFGERVGIQVDVFRYDQNIPEDFLIKDIKEKISDCDGALVQLPLPERIDKRLVLDCIPREKDVDVLSSKSYEYFLNEEVKMLPPVVFAVKSILDKYEVSLEDKKIVVVGGGLLVGRPAFDWFNKKSKKVFLVENETKNKENIILNADIILSGVGKASLIKKEMIKEGVVLLDAGSSQDSGAIVGDISYDCAEKSSIFSRVPGGIGPITIAGIFINMIYNYFNE